MMSSVKAQTEEARRREEEEEETPSESDEYLDLTDEGEEDDGEEERERETRERTGASEELGAANDSTWSFLNREEVERNRSASASALPHLLHFTAEEIASAPGIEAEAFPETGFTESHSSRANLSSSPRHRPPPHRESETQRLNGQTTANCFSGVCDGHQEQPGRSQGQTKPPPSSEAATRSGVRSQADALTFRRSPDGETRTRAAEGSEPRNVPLTYSTPDFSKVEPRIRFPKGVYKPPASRRPSGGSPEPSAAFKSPADAVKEVLLNCPVLTVPQEIRCCQEAIRLIEQLQEEYNILLTKYAESENTIDRLRLGARVNLYSEPPKPGYLLQSALNRNASKVMTLDRPQPQRPEVNSAQRAEVNSAQRAEVNSASLQPNGLDDHQSLDVGQQLAKILYGQADQFLQQLQTFDDQLKRKTLKPSEQVKRLSLLAEGLNSLERGYLFARDEHKVLLQRGEDVSHFDRERELEGLIFQCGLHMDELKEQVEQTRREQPSWEAPPTPPPQPTPSSVPSLGGGALTHPQSPPVPLLVGPGMAAEQEVSSASEEEVEETDDEETLNSLYLKPLSVKHSRFEEFSLSVDHFGSFQELPISFDHGLRDGAVLYTQSGDEETERRRRAESDHQDSPVGSRSGPPPRAPGPSTLLPAHRPSGHRRLEGVKSQSSSSQSSLGEKPASEERRRRSSQLHTGSRRAPPQDGIITPETDSGFVCSESSRLTPAAAPSPVHQRAAQRVLQQDGVTARRLLTDHVSAASPASSLSHRRTAAELRASRPVSPDQSTGSRQRTRGRASSVSWTQLPRVDGGARLTESDGARTASDDGRRNHCTESVNSHHGSSSAAPRHHGNTLRALQTREAANHHDAVRTLQAEVTRLTERLEKTPPLRSVRASPSGQQNYTHHHLTSTPRLRPQERRPSDVRRRARRRADEEEECVLRHTARERSLSVDTQPPPRSDVFTGSEAELSTPRPRTRTSRRTKTSTVASGSCFSHSAPVQSKRSHSRQHPVVSLQVSNAADEPDTGNHQDPVLCPKCSLRRTERPVGGNSESAPSSSSSCRRCPLCGRLESLRVTEQDSHGDSDSSTHTSRQTAESPDRAASSRHAPTAPRPSPQQCMMYSVPVHVSPSNSAGTSLGVRGHVDMDDSLNRAIRAARKMKHTSGHMARSLASGLQYQDQLTQSCRY